MKRYRSKKTGRFIPRKEGLRRLRISRGLKKYYTEKKLKKQVRYVKRKIIKAKKRVMPSDEFAPYPEMNKWLREKDYHTRSGAENYLLRTGQNPYSRQWQLALNYFYGSDLRVD